MFQAIVSARTLRLKCVMIMLIFMNVWLTVDSKRGRAAGKKKKQSTNMTFALYFVGGIFLLTFVPLIGYFLYNVYKDPLTPTLIKNGSELMKEKTMGFLSKRKASDQDDNKDE